MLDNPALKLNWKNGLGFFSLLVSIFSGGEIWKRKNPVILLAFSNEHLKCSSWTQTSSLYCNPTGLFNPLTHLVPSCQRERTHSSDLSSSAKSSIKTFSDSEKFFITSFQSTKFLTFIALPIFSFNFLVENNTHQVPNRLLQPLMTLYFPFFMYYSPYFFPEVF